MNKLVYLHELDSVRNTPEEMLLGQQAMYEEIVVNGNQVVLSFNQITDSRAFLCAIENKNQYKHMIELFRKGYIKFSRYMYSEEDEMCTASQYMQNAIEKNLGKEGDGHKFIFSGLPIQSNETELLRCMYKAIKYSNPMLLDEFESKAESEAEKERIDYLRRYVSTLLALSVEKHAFNQAKKDGKRDFNSFMDYVLKMPVEKYFSGLLEEVKVARKCLEEAKENMIVDVSEKNRQHYCNSRSNWHLELKKETYDAKQPELAEAMVNLVYNYTIEDSIHNVSKHYKDDDIDSFYKDFANRINIFWEEYKAGKHVLRLGEDATTPENYTKYKDWKNFPYWETAVRVIAKKQRIWKKSLKKRVEKEVKKEEKQVERNTQPTCLYEDNYHSEKKRWNIKLVKTLLVQLEIALIYILLMYGYEQASDLINTFATDRLGIIESTLSGAGLFAFELFTYFGLLALSAAIAKFVSIFIDLPDIMESVRSIGVTILDSIRVMLSNKHVAYVRIEKKEKEIE